MRTTLPLPLFFDSLAELRKERGLTTTLLGIGPMSKRIVRVSLQLAERRGFPVMFIASRNQVDSKELGGGYVCSWDQSTFVRTIAEMADEVRFSGLCYICRDHGGPWQRDAEREDRLSPEKALEIAKRSYLQDLLSGFDLLHIDPTKDPHSQIGSGLELVLQRTVELIETIETERRSRALPEISYEVGTEETSGGLTDAAVYGGFIEKLNSILGARDLPLPAFIVGQTGTLVRRSENVGRFDAEAAAALARVADIHSTGLKEHNADYLEDSILLLHPLLGITAANVAPEFGVEETAAYLELSRLEETARNRGALGSSSGVADIIARKSLASERWRKWFTGVTRHMAVEEAERNPETRMQIALVSGHYVFDDPEVAACIEQLRRNLSILGVDLDRYVDYRVAKSIDRYVSCFNLENLTAKVLELRDSHA